MAEHKVITFHYTVKDASGQVLDSSESQEPMTILTGVQQIIPGLEAVLNAMKEGETKNVAIKALDAYGEKQEDLVQTISRSELPAEISVGQMFTVSDDSDEPTHVVTVTAFDETTVTLDANHPLAGQDLVFDVSITETRAATPSEIDHGHVHDGHNHH